MEGAGERERPYVARVRRFLKFQVAGCHDEDKALRSAEVELFECTEEEPGHLYAVSTFNLPPPQREYPSYMAPLTIIKRKLLHAGRGQGLADRHFFLTYVVNSRTIGGQQLEF